MEDLTISDIDILMEGLTAWEANTGGMVGDLLLHLVVDKDTRESDKFKSEEAKREAEKAVIKATRMEASVLLKAKLIGMKNVAVANAI